LPCYINKSFFIFGCKIDIFHIQGPLNIIFYGG
jgi:hypothetical protein